MPTRLAFIPHSTRLSALSILVQGRDSFARCPTVVLRDGKGDWWLQSYERMVDWFKMQRSRYWMPVVVAFEMDSWNTYSIPWVHFFCMHGSTEGTYDIVSCLLSSVQVQVQVQASVRAYVRTNVRTNVRNEALIDLTLVSVPPCTQFVPFSSGDWWRMIVIG